MASDMAKNSEYLRFCLEEDCFVWFNEKRAKLAFKNALGQSSRWNYRETPYEYTSVNDPYTGRKIKINKMELELVCSELRLLTIERRDGGKDTRRYYRRNF